MLTDIIKTGNEELVNLRGQASEYERIMAELKDENPDDYLLNDEYIKVAQGLDGVTSSILEMVKAIKNANEELRNIPVENLEKLIGGYNANISREQARRSLKETNGEAITANDYTFELTNRQNTLSAREELAKLAQDELAERTAAYNVALLNPDNENYNLEDAKKKYQEAIVAAIEADEAVLQAQTDLANTESEANEANRKQFDNRLTLLKNLRERISSERELAEIKGFNVTVSDIRMDISVSKETKRALEEQLADLELNNADLDAYEYSTRRLEIIKQIKAEEAKMVDYAKQMADVLMTSSNEYLEDLKEASDEISRQIEFISHLNKDVPVELLQQQLENIGETIT